MVKKIQVNKLTLMIISLLLLTGCWDQNAIDKRAYVLGIGLDKTDQEGILEITYLISNPEAGSTQQGGGTEEPSHEIITFNASSFIHSQSIANAVIAKNVTYDILDLFVVSEELAKDENFIRWIYDATKDSDVRRDTRLVVSKEPASKYIKKNKPRLETRRHEYFELMFSEAGSIGLIPDTTIHDFFRITEAGSDLFVTPYTTTEDNENTSEKNIDSELIAGNLKVKGDTNPAQFLGSAIFKEGKMIGTLTVQETRITQLINANMRNFSFLAAFPDPFIKDYWITARYTQETVPEIKVDVTPKPPKIKVVLPLFVEVLTDHSMVNYAKNQEKRELLRDHIIKRIEEHITELVKRTKEEFKGQPFSFSIAARKHFFTMQEWDQYNWMKTYPEADVEVRVDVTFGEFGRQSELPDFEKVRGKE